MRPRTIAMLACSTLGGCYEGLGQRPDEAASVGTGGASESAGTSDAASSEGGDPTEPDPCAESAADPLRRLTSSQYTRSVTALTEIELSATLLGLLAPVEAPEGAFDNAADALLVRQSDADAYQRIAESVARDRFGGDAAVETWVGCAAADPTCLDDFIARFARAAYRRPITEDEGHALRSLALGTPDDGTLGAWAPFSTVVEAVLQSPKFVFVLEPSSETAGDQIALDDYQIATRLALALWDQIPDAALLDRARDGALGDPQARSEIVASMLADPRADAALQLFAGRWFRTDAVDGADFVEAATSSDAAALRRDAKAEIAALLDAHVVHGDLREVYTSQHARISPSLASIYGVALGDPAAVGELDVDFAPEHLRGGIFGTAGFLSLTASAEHASPVQRGVFVRRVSLCSEPPPPPAGVPMDDATSDDHASNPSCWACHVALDPVGWGLDRYGPNGALRSEGPDGRPLHESGYFAENEGVTFADAAALGAAVLEHPSFAGCAAQSAMTWFFAKAPGNAEACVAETLTAEFVGGGYQMRWLVGSLLADDSMTRRTMPAAVEGDDD